MDRSDRDMQCIKSRLHWNRAADQKRCRQQFDGGRRFQQRDANKRGNTPLCRLRMTTLRFTQYEF